MDRETTFFPPRLAIALSLTEQGALLSSTVLNCTFMLTEDFRTEMSYQYGRAYALQVHPVQLIWALKNTAHEMISTTRRNEIPSFC